MDKKIAVITGCSKKSGVGYNLACELLERGFKVIATVRNIERSELNKLNIPKPENLDIQVLDLCQKDSIDAFIKRVLSKYSYIDILVNNAANVAIGPVESAAEEDVLTTYQTKVFGPLALIRGFVPVMRQRRRGILTTTSSIFTSLPISMPGVGVYFSALAAFERLQESLAIELAPWNIKVINFQAGPIATELTRFEGSRTDIINEHYKNFTQQAYQWYDPSSFQTGTEVAQVFAEAIEAKEPDLCYQSSTFGRKLVETYRDDATGNQSFNVLVKHFENLYHEDECDWKIQRPTNS